MFRDLTFKSSMAAVRSSNQLAVAVTRVEGTDAYKRLMRMGNAPSLDETVNHGSWCPLYNAWIPQSVQDHLSYCRGDPDVDEMRVLLGKLKTAAEAQLGHAICLVNINLLDRRILEGRMGQIIGAAIDNLGLTDARPQKPNAYAMVLRNEGWYSLNYEPFESLLFLIIESDSSGAISLDLSMIDEGIGDLIQQHHNITGTTLPSECHGDGAVSASCKKLATQRRVIIRETVAKFTTPPYVGWIGQTPPTTLSKILVHGDAAEDAGLHEELRTVFGSDLSSKIIARDPTYASTLGAADTAFRTINEPYYDINPSFWCCLRSWAKACPHGLQKYEL